MFQKSKKNSVSPKITLTDCLYFYEMTTVTQVTSATSVKGIDPRTVFEGPVLEGAGFEGSGLEGSGLEGSGLEGSGLDGSGLGWPGLEGSGLEGSGLEGSGLEGSGLEGSGLEGSGYEDPQDDFPQISIGNEDPVPYYRKIQPLNDRKVEYFTREIEYKFDQDELEGSCPGRCWDVVEGLCVPDATKIELDCDSPGRIKATLDPCLFTPEGADYSQGLKMKNIGLYSVKGTKERINWEFR